MGKNNKRGSLNCTVSRLRVAMGTLIGARECLKDSLKFADRGIDICRRAIQDELLDQAKASDSPTETLTKTTGHVCELIKEWQQLSRSWGWMAAELNRLGYHNSRGRPWTPGPLLSFWNRTCRIREADDQAARDKTD